MKRILKRVVKSVLLLFIISVVLLSIGILLPLETYKQKQEIIADVLLTNCNIVDLENGIVKTNQKILVKGGKIVAIDSAIRNTPLSVKIVDANQSFVIPALWDMHLHTISLSPQLHFPLLIANGVTGIRDMGDGDSWISDIDDSSERDKSIWERAAIEKSLLVPKIPEATSFHLEEIDEEDVPVQPEKIKFLVEKLRRRGEPFIKVQLEASDLSDTNFYLLQEEASRQGIPVLGHLSASWDVQTVIRNGFRSIEHAWALIPHAVKIKANLEKDIDRKRYDLLNQDTELLNGILREMSDNHVFYVPTHVSSNRKEFMAFDNQFNNDPRNMYTENTQLFFWKILNWLHVKGYDREKDLPVLKNYYQRGLEITQLANQSGVKVLAGTDALDRNVYYGFSLHDELQEMVDAGLSNAEALRTATIYPTDYFGLSDRYGSITIGKMADFLLLDKNPLDKISNTRSINTVFYNNRIYTKMDLEEMKSFVKKQANSYGVTCKFIWNMIKRN